MSLVAEERLPGTRKRADDATKSCALGVGSFRRPFSCCCVSAWHRGTHAYIRSRNMKFKAFSVQRVISAVETPRRG